LASSLPNKNPSGFAVRKINSPSRVPWATGTPRSGRCVVRRLSDFALGSAVFAAGDAEFSLEGFCSGLLKGIVVMGRLLGVVVVLVMLGPLRV
ncbi:hypothetical protein, partial [Haloechinothrix salitolerans]|uniref:hypothetical protein n=1 Tax=Haloechinothrix salitolerans TaxID=926830 RepID=UPI0035E6E3F6